MQQRDGQEGRGHAQLTGRFNGTVRPEWSSAVAGEEGERERGREEGERGRGRGESGLW